MQSRLTWAGLTRYSWFSAFFGTLLEGWRSGQSQQTVNLPGPALRWFESSSLHHTLFKISQTHSLSLWLRIRFARRLDESDSAVFSIWAKQALRSSALESMPRFLFRIMSTGRDLVSPKAFIPRVSVMMKFRIAFTGMQSMLEPRHFFEEPCL